MSAHYSVPILEIYAPVRQTGTNKIIALAETSELAVGLMQEIHTAQYTSYAVLASGAIGLILVLFGLTGGLQRQIGELARQQAARQAAATGGSAAPTAGSWKSMRKICAALSRN